jgi:cobalt-zinc-cadmium efflux system outer membrane protein
MSLTLKAPASHRHAATAVLTTLTCTWLLANTAAQEPPSPGGAVTLEALEQVALERHPAIAAARAAADAARGRGAQAGFWPNPRLEYEAENLKSSDTDPRGEHTFLFEQTIPLGGKLRLSREALEQGVTAADAALAASRQQVLNGVRAGYYIAMAAELRVQVRERLARLAGEAEQVSRQLFNVGAADRPDVLASEIEGEHSRLDLVEARTGRTRAWRRLAIAVGDPEMSERTLTGALDRALPTLDREATLRSVLADHPSLAEAKAQVAQAELTLARAQRETRPDLTVRAGPRYNREHFARSQDRIGWEWVLGAGIELPLVNRNPGGVAAAQANVAAAREALRGRELEIRARFEDAYEAYFTALQMAEQYRTSVVPKADEAYRLNVAKYREMAAAYPQVLIAQRALFESTERYVDLVERIRVAAVLLQGYLIPASPGSDEGR